jgi:hypothetical protein
MLAIIKTDGAFLSKFSNPFNMKSADFRMEGEEKEQFLMHVYETCRLVNNN